MIKYIFSDMDGTLLDENVQLPAEFGDMLQELKKRNCQFIIATGRQYWGLLKMFDKYKDDLLFLADNGAYMGSATEELFCSVMDRETAYEVIHRIDQMPDYIMPILTGKKHAYARDEWKDNHEEFKKYNTLVTFVDSFHDIDDEFIKISVADRKYENSKENIYDKFLDITDRLKTEVSNELWVDFMAKGVNKGYSIRRFQKMMNIKPEECAAFGDYLNDMEMMDTVEWSFAMANAHPDLLKKAKYSCGSNVEHGVIKKIYELMEEGII